MLAFSPHELKLLRLGTRYNNNKPRDPVKFREGDTETYKQGESSAGLREDISSYVAFL
jgi:hypothetical protein